MLLKKELHLDTQWGCRLNSVMKSVNARLNNIVGQIEGVKKMMENDTECVKVLTQLKAIKSGISRVMDMVVEDQLDGCLKSLKESDKNLLINLKKYVKSD
jgi:DNA-binding FrmR family transcriptional regulator